MAKVRVGLMVLLVLCQVFVGVAQPLRPFGQLDTLCNGLRVSSYNTNDGRARIAFALAMQVGSVHEASPQEEGVAHFLEHLLCDDTLTVTALAAQGNRYGAEFNAYTGYDRTIYLFSLPATLDTAAALVGHLMRRWLGDMHFDSASIARQRRVVLREIADFIPPDWLMLDKLSGKLHLDHFPIGRASHVTALTHEQLSAFYKHYYTPSNATLVVVGDWPEGFLDDLKRHLSALPMGSGEKASRAYDLFANPVTICRQRFDTAASQLHFELSWPYRYPLQYSRQQWLENRLRQAAVHTLNEQLSLRGCDVRLSAERYLFSDGFMGLDGSVDSVEELYSALRAALELLTAFASHVPGDSLHAALVKRAKQMVASKPEAEPVEILIEEALVERCGGVDTGEVAWGVRQIGAQTKDDWQRVLRAVVPSGAPMVAGYRGAVVVDTVRANAAMRQGSIEGRKAMQAPQLLLPSPDSAFDLRPVPQWLSRELPPQPRRQPVTFLPHIGCHTFRLSNGIPVVYKETVATDSVLYLELLWPGGYTSLDAPTRPEQEVLATSLEQVNLGDLSPEALSSLLYQERISWLPIVEAGHHRLMLSCPAPKTTETLNFLHALLTEAHYDTLYIGQMRRDMLEELPKENVAASFCVDHQLRAAVDRDFTYGSPDRQAWSHLTASAVQTFYDTLFTAREGLQIVAVGPLGVDTLTSFLEATIGRCGLRRASELPLPAFRQLQGSKPDGQREGNREFACYFMGYPMEQGLRGSLIVRLMQNLLLQQANSRIRNASGLVYSPYVSFIAPIREGGPYLMALRGACAGKALDTALATARECFVQLASQPVSQVTLGQLQKTFRLNRADALGPLASAISWRDYLAEQLLAGITPEELDCYEAILQSITPDMLQQAFQQLVAQGMCGELLE